jgi:hypothetical protein
MGVTPHHSLPFLNAPGEVAGGSGNEAKTRRYDGMKVGAQSTDTRVICTNNGRGNQESLVAVDTRGEEAAGKGQPTGFEWNSVAAHTS